MPGLELWLSGYSYNEIPAFWARIEQPIQQIEADSGRQVEAHLDGIALRTLMYYGPG